MKSLSVQFHALPSEILELFVDLFCDKLIFVTEAVGSPLKFQRWQEIDAPKFDQNRRAFAFTLDEPNTKVTDMYQFRNLNPNALILELGQILPAGLTESWLSAMTVEPLPMSRWKGTVRHLRAATLTGAKAINPHNGAIAPMKGHRFTKLAQESFANGMAMLPAAGNSVVNLSF